MKPIQIETRLLINGFSVTIANRKYRQFYPQSVWKHLNFSLKKQLAESAALFFTYHLTLSKKLKFQYAFPPPQAFSLFFHGLIFSLPEMVIEMPEAQQKTSQLLQNIFNSSFNIKFDSSPNLIKAEKFSEINKKTAIIPFSFGKDSLLSFGLTREIGIKSRLYYFAEPSSKYENKNKYKLSQEFFREFKVKVDWLNNELGNLRSSGKMLWGWDLLVTQYTLLLIPILNELKTEYLFWSNEQSTNELTTDKENFIINPSFEQSSQWTLNLNNLLRIFFIGAKIESLLEPIHELVILFMLHHRYPEIGKYQLSCFNDHKNSKNKRWCGECYECARVYLFLTAIGYEPKIVGLVDDMFAYEKKSLHYFFYKSKTANTDGKFLIENFSERMLAFYLVYKRGHSGELVRLFQKNFLRLVEKYLPYLIRKILKIYKSETISENIKRQILPIYNQEIIKLRQEITELL